MNPPQNMINIDGIAGPIMENMFGGGIDNNPFTLSEINNIASIAVGCIANNSILCKYGIKCKKMGCTYNHVNASISTTPCKYGPRCTRENCFYDHSQEYKSDIPCIYGDECTRGERCFYDHSRQPVKLVVRCKYGANCKRGDKCLYNHDIQMDDENNEAYDQYHGASIDVNVPSYQFLLNRNGGTNRNAYHYPSNPQPQTQSKPSTKKTKQVATPKHTNNDVVGYTPPKPKAKKKTK